MQALVSAIIEVEVDEWQFLVATVNEPYLGFSPTANGLVRSVGGAAVVATGIHSGLVTVECEAYPADPGPVRTDGPHRWTEIAEVPLHVPSDDVRVTPLMSHLDLHRTMNLAVNGPGLYQLRVCAYGRDTHVDDDVERNDEERYLVQLWPTMDPRNRLVAGEDSVGAAKRRSHEESDESPDLGVGVVNTVPQRIPAIWHINDGR